MVNDLNGCYALIAAVIQRACDDLLEEYKKYICAYGDLKPHQDRAAERRMSNIRYFEGWLIEAVPEWTSMSGKYLIEKYREKAVKECRGE